MNRAVDQLLGGWKLNGTVIAYSGLPVTISGPITTSVNNKTARANHYRKLKIVNRSVGNWFGTDPSSGYALGANGQRVNNCASLSGDNGVCAYSTTTVEQYGISAVGTERPPGCEH